MTDPDTTIEDERGARPSRCASIPGALDATADRLPGRGGHRRRRPPPDLGASCARRRSRRRRAFVAAGIEPGDRVGIWAPNCWEWVAALPGLQPAGGVAVPLNSRYKGGEAA